jgi:hypothetical protein
MRICRYQHKDPRSRVTGSSCLLPRPIESRLREMLVRSLKTVSDVRFVVPSACSLSSSSASATRTFAATSAELLNPLPRRAEARSGASECVDDDASAGEDAAQPMRIVAISSAFTRILVRELQKPCRLVAGSCCSQRKFGRLQIQ